MKKKFEIIIERVPMLTPIGIIWDTCETHRTLGIIKVERRRKKL